MERAVLFERLPELLFFALLREVLRCEREVLPDFFDPLLDFFFEPVLPELLREDEREEDLRGGTLSPSRRASERPMAIACFGLVTFFPLRPLRSLPSFISCISS